MDVFAMLTADHKEARQLFEKIESTTQRALKSRTEIFDKLNHELTLHMHVEEEILYPALKEHKQTRPNGFESIEEHKIVKLLLSEIASLSPDSEEWAAKLAVLKENFEHHVKEEEQEIFPKVRKIFSSDELEDLTALVEEQKLRLVADPFQLVQ